MAIEWNVGLADVTYDGEELPMLGDVCEFRVEELVQDLTAPAYAGETVLGKLNNGYNVTATVSFAEDSIEVVKLALDAHEDDTTGNLTDNVIGRVKSGSELIFHPRSMGDDTSKDITIYNAVIQGDFTRSYQNEQSYISVTFTALPKDGYDLSQPDNFFRIGDGTI